MVEYDLYNEADAAAAGFDMTIRTSLNDRVGDQGGNGGGPVVESYATSGGGGSVARSLKSQESWKALMTSFKDDTANAKEARRDNVCKGLQVIRSTWTMFGGTLGEHAHASLIGRRGVPFARIAGIERYGKMVVRERLVVVIVGPWSLVPIIPHKVIQTAQNNAYCNTSVIRVHAPGVQFFFTIELCHRVRAVKPPL